MKIFLKIIGIIALVGMAYGFACFLNFVDVNVLPKNNFFDTFFATIIAFTLIIAMICFILIALESYEISQEDSNNGTILDSSIDETKTY